MFVSRDEWCRQGCCFVCWLRSHRQPYNWMDVLTRVILSVVLLVQLSIDRSIFFLSPPKSFIIKATHGWSNASSLLIIAFCNNSFFFLCFICCRQLKNLAWVLVLTHREYSDSQAISIFIFARTTLMLTFFFWFSLLTSSGLYLFYINHIRSNTF